MEYNKLLKLETTEDYERLFKMVGVEYLFDTHTYGLADEEKLIHAGIIKELWTLYQTLRSRKILQRIDELVVKLGFIHDVENKQWVKVTRI